MHTSISMTKTCINHVVYAEIHVITSHNYCGLIWFLVAVFGFHIFCTKWRSIGFFVSLIWPQWLNEYSALYRSWHSPYQFFVSIIMLPYFLWHLLQNRGENNLHYFRSLIWKILQQWFAKRIPSRGCDHSHFFIIFKRARNSKLPFFCRIKLL